MKIVYKGEKELKTDLQYVKFMERLVSVHTFVAEDFTLEVILCMSINESSSSKILDVLEQDALTNRNKHPFRSKFKTSCQWS